MTDWEKLLFHVKNLSLDYPLPQIHQKNADFCVNPTFLNIQMLCLGLVTYPIALPLSYFCIRGEVHMLSSAWELSFTHSFTMPACAHRVGGSGNQGARAETLALLFLFTTQTVDVHCRNRDE